VRAIRTTCVIVGALIVSTFGFLIPALADHTPLCGDVTVVFARGSGQDLREREAPVFFDSVDNRLGVDVRVTRYELGTESQGGARYPAVGGWRDVLEAEASWTGFLGGRYRASVAAGVTELTSYLTQRADACPGEIFVVGGYSQGAQVVGEALFELNSATRDRIAFVALFSDPKLYLPEGRGPFPPACRGKESPWRRGSVSCWTDNGILEARKPYLPEDIEDRTGSWCDRNDGVCVDNPADLALYDDHAEYGDGGAEIDDAAREIAGALDNLLPDADIDATSIAPRPGLEDNDGTS
jgi:hypothetical protein